MLAPVEHWQSPLRSGWRWLARRSNGHRLHAGVDLMAPEGTPVRAPERCQVVVARATRTPHEVETNVGVPLPWDGYGPAVVVVRGASGWFHVLAHSARMPLPIVGAVFAEGETLARIGPLTGGTHTHWEVRSSLRAPAGRAVVEVCADPFTWLTGAPHVWTHNEDVCPLAPDDTRKTPGPCRPTTPLPPLGARTPPPFDVPTT